MSGLLRSAVVASLLLVVPAGAGAERVRLDGIVAIVGATSPRPGAVVVLASDVELEVRLGRARAGATVGHGAAAPTAEELAEARERLVGRGLLVWEAARLRLDDVDGARVAAEWRRFFERHGGARSVEALVAELGLGNDELEHYVRAEAVARAFLLASAEEGGIVTDAELEAAWERGDHAYEGMDLETVREAYRIHLLEQRIALEATRWIERLRQRVPMRVSSRPR